MNFFTVIGIITVSTIIGSIAGITIGIPLITFIEKKVKRYIYKED